ncbi:cellulase family glycosylhydrolase [Thermococcus sp.]|uniref:cellulase family glycosylhydrolase n=1 Tax=Thermococcus sp. TaxID=35749 RepID=UPI002616600B|nr:cellulase family glycosylhydrolase [Thermococcus sp.]
MKIKAGLIALLLVFSLFSVHGASVSASEGPEVYYKVVGDTIYMVNLTSGEEKPIHLYGVNWFGFETPNHVVHGLWSRNWVDMLEQIKSLGFNAIRLPFCPESLDPNTMPTGIDYAKNPDLKGLSSPEIMEKIIQKAGELGIFVLLDFHRIGCNYIEPLWYTDSFSEEDYINTWIKVAQMFGKYWNVIGADLKNEPHSVSQAPYAYTDGKSATWGMGNNATDWNLAAERIGKAILNVAPHWLIFVEGTQFTNPETDGSYKWGYNAWWGGNLMAVRDFPVNLPRDKLVYSPHVYGPDVYDQPYFDESDFPSNMPDIWYHHFGYVKMELGYPLVIGEFGGKYGHGGDKRDVIWQKTIVDWMINNSFCDFFYWSWNPNSGDTGGLLQDDWIHIWKDKYENLKRLMDYCSGRPAPSTPNNSSESNNTGGNSSTSSNSTTNNLLINESSGNTNITKENTKSEFKIINILPTSSQYNGIFTSVTCDGTKCSSSVWGTPNLWGVVNIGNATIDPNVWGWQDLYKDSPEKIGNGTSRMWIENEILHVNNRWTIKTRPAYNVMAYNEVIYGSKPWGGQPINAPELQLPLGFKALPRILVATEYTLEKGIPGNNFAFEAWLFKDSNNNRAPGKGDYEIMVQLYVDGGFPAGYDKGPVATFEVPMIVNGGIINQTFELYDVVADPGWRFLTFKSTKNYVNTSVVFDYTYFLELANEYLNGSLENNYLMSLEFGTEIYTNRITSFPDTVHVDWTLERYYYVLAPREQSTYESLSALIGNGSQNSNENQGNENGEESGTQSNNSSNQTSESEGGTENPTSPSNRTISIIYPDDGQWPTAYIDRNGNSNPDYVIEINPWNIQSADGKAVMRYDIEKGVLYYSQNLTNIVIKNAGGWVHGYPEIWYGNKPWNSYNATDGPVPLPRKISELKNFYVTLSYNLSHEKGLPVDLAIESWLTRDKWRSTGIKSDEQELMIWLYYDGLQPAGSKVGEIMVPILLNGKEKNVTFEVWTGNIGWEYIAFRIKTPIKAGNVTLPYGPFISVAMNITSLKDYSSLYLEDVEVGTEFGSPDTKSAKLNWTFNEFTLQYSQEPLLTNISISNEEDQNQGSNEAEIGNATSGNISVVLKSVWGGGAQYDVSIMLNEPSRWNLFVKISNGTIVDSWGAKVIGREGNYIVLTAEDYNLGPSASVGFVTKGNSPLVEEIVLKVNGKVLATWKPEIQSAKLDIQGYVDSEWNNGFVFKVKITNIGDTPIAGWQIKLSMTSEIVSIWGATFEKAGDGTIILKPIDCTSIIAPGQSIEIGFQAIKAGDNPYPEIIDYTIV